MTTITKNTKLMINDDGSNTSGPISIKINRIEKSALIYETSKNYGIGIVQVSVFIGPSWVNIKFLKRKQGRWPNDTNVWLELARAVHLPASTIEAIDVQYDEVNA